MPPSNLLVIMSDEHQARAMGCAGHPFVQTPNLDALAARGLRFTDAYTPSPICVPARAAFAAGQPVHVTRLWDNAMPYTGEPRGWGHALQGAGVPVESIGKLHYRSDEDPAGFDVEHIPMQVAGGVGMVWASIRKEEERIDLPGRMLGDYIGPGDSKYTEYDSAVTDRTAQWFADRAASGDTRPWCLYVGLVAPHFPLVVPQDYFDLYPLDSLPPVKLHPRDGHPRHPWVEKQNSMADSEAQFRDEAERLSAMAAYYGLCTWLDHNVGQILAALDAAGFGQDTTIVYTSDHGDNVGARGLWGKSNLYQESVSIPLIMAGPDVAAGTCDTPVSLLDLSATIPAHFGVPFRGAGQPLPEIAAHPADPDRAILSEYHAVGAVSGAFMLRKGRWKLNHYIGFRPELFDLQNDPEELTDLAADPAHADTLAVMQAELRAQLDPEAANAQAFADQAALIERYGGREKALKLGAPAATPPPKVTT
ncbi:sulfatase-like hydrolase/transferase [Marimonas lutisalis]|uniref:sulfatase-like hydrolase/transferase n=1 Tax=Marimonas lutisalis TaxID=2545756 RepID=UPI0010FA6336|nr:sulfatase-like hydrolase/transferase [Marimonas lutisalis]